MVKIIIIDSHLDLDLTKAFELFSMSIIYLHLNNRSNILIETQDNNLNTLYSILI